MNTPKCVLSCADKDFGYVHTDGHVCCTDMLSPRMCLQMPGRSPFLKNLCNINSIDMVSPKCVSSFETFSYRLHCYGLSRVATPKKSSKNKLENLKE